MKSTFLLLSVLLTAFCSQGQSQRPVIILTSHDVDTNSVRLITQPTTPEQNVVFRYLGKTSPEIKAIRDSNPCFKIMQDGVVVAETHGGCGGWVDKHTNYVGLVLISANMMKVKRPRRHYAEGSDESVLTMRCATYR